MVSAAYSVAAWDEIISQGELSPDAPVQIDELPEGEYLVTLTLPENVVLTVLNGYAIVQRGTAQWMASVLTATESVYAMELTLTGDVVVPVADIPGAKVSVTGAGESYELTADAEGRYVAENLLPDNYTVYVSLPAGRYDYDAACWTMTENADGTFTAAMTFDVSENATIELPAIALDFITGSVSGTVKSIDGDALSGVQVSIYDSNGQLAATAETDSSGAWRIGKLAYGEYTAQYFAHGQTITASRFTLSESRLSAKLSAFAQASEPAEITDAEQASEPAEITDAEQTPESAKVTDTEQAPANTALIEVAQGPANAKVTVRAFIDNNNNGTRNKGEDFLKNVEVSLVNGSGGIVDSGVTDRNGYVTLSAQDGRYKLRVHAPEDYGFGKQGDKLDYTESIMAESASRTQDSAFITLTAEEKLEVGVGMLPMATVRGAVWKDVNGDGIWQKDEPGIPGIRLTIEGGKDKELQEFITDENGRYEFRQLKKGNYELLCYVPDEYVFTGKAKGDTAVISRMTTEKDRVGRDTFSLDRGDVRDDHNIGLMDGAIIEGVCFLDANSNGTYDQGDLPLPGVELRLARQSNNVMLQKTTSDESGAYRFVGQRGSTFTIRATLPKGCVFTTTAAGDEGNKFEPNGNKNERRLTDLTVENGGYRKINLGAVRYGSISGRVYFDENFSSDWESGETLGIGYSVSLWNAQGNKIATKKTDKNGLFSFNDLLVGEYYLTMKPETGYAFTALGRNNVMQTLADGTGKSSPIKVGLDEDVKNAGIGMIIPATVTGKVFADENDNGMQDAGEKGLSGAYVLLMNDEGGEAGLVKVDASGEYRFNAVLPGRYFLLYEMPEKGVFAKVVNGGNTIAGEEGIGTGVDFTIQAGDTWTAPLCGGVLLSDISGVAYVDSNGNSVMDADEAPMPGMRINLTPTRSDLEAVSIVTDADGKFAFNDLRPDTYTLSVECPGEYVISRLSGVKLPVKSGLTAQETTFRLAMGTQWHNQMLGCVIPATWTGEAYLDENWNGRRDTEEAPAIGETLELRDADTGEMVFTVTTDENGVFTIEGIAPGAYELVYPLDEGNLQAKDGSGDFFPNGDVMTNGYVVIRAAEAKSGTSLCVVRTTEIGGMVWLEQFSGVTPVKGAKLHLLDASGNPIAEYTTADDGRYVFKGLMPGDYAVDVTIPAGYVLVDGTDPRIAEKGLISFVEEAQGLFGKSAVITLKMARHIRNMDAGMVLPGRLGDKVWLDLNGNGLQDGEEGGIPGVTIELMRGEKVVATTVSDQYGYYIFEELYPTEYTLRVTWPGEVKPTILRTEIPQISSVLQENGISIPVTVESNKANYAADLGFVLVEEGKLPAGYGEGATQVWKKK